MGMGVRRREALPPDPVDIIWPSHLKLTPDHAELGDRCVRCYTVVGYPREVQPGWFEPLIGFSQPLSIVLRSGPIDTGAMVKSMNRRMIWHRGAADADRAQGRLSRADQVIALQDAEHVRLDLASGQARVMEVGLTVAVWASSVEALEQTCRLFESLAQGMMMVVRPLRYQQLTGLKQLLPLGHAADKVREMDSRAWATLFPFSSRDVIHPQGQVLGMNPISRSLIMVDRFQMASPHSITIGWSGAGKSFAAKLEAVRSRYRGIAVSVVDPEGEYRWLGHLGAAVFEIGSTGQKSAQFPYDPFTISAAAGPEEVGRQADFLIRLLRRLSPDLMDEYGSAVHDAIWRVLNVKRGHFSLNGSDDLDIAALLQEMGQDNRRARDRLELVWQRWQRAVGMAGPGVSGSFEVFDFSRVSEGMKGPVYLALTEWLLRRMGRDAARRLVIFDEAWHLLTDHQSAPYLEEMFRRARKWDTALSLLSQDIGDFTRSRAAEVCLRNAPMLLLLRQHPESVDEVARLMRLHEGEIQVVAAAGPGEGLLLLADDHLPLRVVASPHEQQLLMETGGKRT